MFFFRSELTIKKRSKKSSREAELKNKQSELNNNNVMKDNSQDERQKITKPQTNLMRESRSNRKDIEEALLRDAFETLNLQSNT